ncbi:MAG: hypothetical protein HYX73_00545 [Acidobacteria bacterium]|nr:hypothetical protein [Acidobacteriota bacterium]
MEPKHLLDSWNEISPRIRGRLRIVLLSDFDGTLVRIHRYPKEVQIPSPVQNLLAAISGQGLTVGVVSGRDLGDLRARVGVKRNWYVAAHGLAVRPPAGQRSSWQPRHRRNGCPGPTGAHAAAKRAGRNRLGTEGCRHRSSLSECPLAKPSPCPRSGP